MERKKHRQIWELSSRKHGVYGLYHALFSFFLRLLWLDYLTCEVYGGVKSDLITNEVIS